MSAGVLIRDDAERVLFVVPSYKEHWDIPGGVCEDGEAPWRTARRECAEEIGIDRSLGPLLVIDYVPSDGRMPEGLAFIFDGGRITADDAARLKLTDPEILSVQLLSLDDAAPRLKPSLGRRIHAALAAVQAGEAPVICEDGHPVTG